MNTQETDPRTLLSLILYQRLSSLVATGLWLGGLLAVQAQTSPPAANLQLWLKADTGVTVSRTFGGRRWSTPASVFRA